MPPTLQRFSPFSVENAVLSYVQDRTFVQAEYVCSCRPRLMETPSEFVPSDGSKIYHRKYTSNFYEDKYLLTVLEILTFVYRLLCSTSQSIARNRLFVPVGLQSIFIRTAHLLFVSKSDHSNDK